MHSFLSCVIKVLLQLSVCCGGFRDCMFFEGCGGCLGFLRLSVGCGGFRGCIGF